MEQMFWIEGIERAERKKKNLKTKMLNKFLKQE